ncbi:thioesterase [Bacterioplanes sanyensis]|uniref:Thioesterase n=1 Tax=Bacterioplanes sanyensis TaxID=1249553 RepID=A0A222FGV1_9GAMM|nr:thioesterase family protein [Bacterioplanes sanyensis]ASP37816.1 thioesterase [Bacterioplanes sanyensis]
MSAIHISRTILFGECDPAGIVYTPRFTDFALEATHQTLSERLGKPCIRTLNEAGLATPVRHTEIDYLHPLRYDQRLQQSVVIREIGKHSYTFGVVGYVGEKNIYRATISYVTLSSQTLQKVPVPAWLRDMLTQLQVRS